MLLVILLEMRQNIQCPFSKILFYVRDIVLLLVDLFIYLFIHSFLTLFLYITNAPEQVSISSSFLLF